MKKTQSIVSIFLCLILLFSVVSSPVEVQASGIFSGFFLRSVGASLLFSGASEVAPLLPDAFGELSAALADFLSPAFDEFVKEQETMSELTGISKFHLKQSWLDDIAYFLLNIAVDYGAEIHDLDLDLHKIVTNSDQILVDDEGEAYVEIYLPSEEVLDRPGLVTQEQLLTGDFSEALTWEAQLLYDINLGFDNLRETLAADERMLREEIEYWMGAVNQTTATFERSIKDWIADLNYNTVLYGQQSVQWLGNVNQTASQIYKDLPSHFLDLRQELSGLTSQQKEWLGYINDTTALYGDKTVQWLDNVNTSLSQIYKDFPDEFLDLQLSLSTLKTTLHDDLFSLETKLLNSFSGLKQELQKLDDTQEEWLGNINSTTSKWGKDTVDWIKTLNSNLVHCSGKLQTSFDGLSQKLDEKFEVFPALQQDLDALLDVFPAITQKLDTIIEKIPVYVENEVEVLQKPQIQVQIHDQQQVLVSDYASLTTAFELKLNWITDIFNFLQELFDRISYTGSAPKVVIPLSSASGTYTYGIDSYVLDFSWYESFKSYGDTIISGFLWLGFGWNLYKRTPSIISGLGITTEHPASGSK